MIVCPDLNLVCFVSTNITLQGELNLFSEERKLGLVV